MRDMRPLLCLSVVLGLLAPDLRGQAGLNVAGFNLPADRLYFTAIREAKGMGKVLASDEKGLTFKFRYAPSDLMYTDIIVTVTPTSETASSLETDVSQGGFLSTDVVGGRRGREDAQYYVMQLREELMEGPPDLGSRQCFPASPQATTAAALRAAEQLGMVPKGRDERFFHFLMNGAEKKTEVSLEVFQETRGSSCVQVLAWKDRKATAAWFRMHKASKFPEFFDLLRKGLLPAPAASATASATDARH